MSPERRNTTGRVKRPSTSRKVLRQHRYELVDLVVTAETGEERDGCIDHAQGLGDHDRAAAEAGQPVPLAGVVALDPMGLLLANIEPALRDQLGVSFPTVGAVEAHPPALQAFEEPRSEEHTSELQSRQYLVCRLLLEKKHPSFSLHSQHSTSFS